MIVQIALGVFVFLLVVGFVMVGIPVFHPTKEGFDAVPDTYFQPTVTPGGNEEASTLHPNAAMNPLTEKLASTPTMPLEEAQANWGRMTSEQCYRSDIGESLKKTRNYLQRTNNYARSHPDDCSAPRHEFVGTFYTPFEGVGSNPASGGKYPASTQKRTMEVC